MTQVKRTVCEVCGTLRRWCRVCHVRRCVCLPSRCLHIYQQWPENYATWVSPAGGQVWCRTTGQKPKTGNRSGVTLMPLGKAKRLMGVRKGAEAMHAAGKAHQWNSETARAAVRKWWKSVRRSKRLGGIALGLKLKRRKAVDHKALRKRYANNMTRSVWFDPETERWLIERPGCESRVLSERAALIRLGHLPSTRVFIPDEILKKRDGMGPA